MAKRTFAPYTWRARTWRSGAFAGASAAPPFVNFVCADAIHETSRTAGTGALTLLGAEPGKFAFASVMAAGDACPGVARSRTTDEVEITVFTMQGDGTLARADVPYKSSNAGAPVAFSGALLDVFLDLPVRLFFGAVVAPAGYQKVLR